MVDEKDSRRWNLRSRRILSEVIGTEKRGSVLDRMVLGSGIQRTLEFYYIFTFDRPGKLKSIKHNGVRVYKYNYSNIRKKRTIGPDNSQTKYLSLITWKVPFLNLKKRYNLFTSYYRNLLITVPLKYLPL